MTIIIILSAVFIVTVVALSGIGVCERCKMGKGGVYFLLSHVMGGRIGGSLGVIYCFAQVQYFIPNSMSVIFESLCLSVYYSSHLPFSWTDRFQI